MSERKPTIAHVKPDLLEHITAKWNDQETPGHLLGPDEKPIRPDTRRQKREKTK